MNLTEKQRSEEYRNKNYELDFKYASEINNWTLKPIGIWFIGRNYSIMDKVARILSIFNGTFFQLFLIVPWIFYIVVENLSFYEVVRMAVSLILLISCGLKYSVMLLRDDQIRTCMDHTKEDWRDVQSNQQRDIMIRNAKVGRFMCIASIVFLFTGGVTYCLLPVVTTGPMTKNNVTLKLHPNPNELLIFDNQVSPVYEIVYIFQGVSSYVAYCIVCGSSGLTAEFVTHACGQFEIIMTLLSEMSDNKHCESFDKKMATVILKHLRILRFISNIESLFTEIYMTEFMSASGIICLVGYYVVTDLEQDVPILTFVMYIFLFISTLFNIFVFCYLGELLIHQCQKVGFACYTVGWYQLPHRKALNLILPIAIADYPTELSAGGMMTLSLESFSSILRASMAYFNLLRQVV